MATSTQQERSATERSAQLLRACQDAADRLYDAEVALHTARETLVDEWTAAAYDRLHLAVAAHAAAAAQLAAS